MSDVDLEHSLVDLGVDAKLAAAIQSKIDGRDLVALTTALANTNIPTSIARANRVLSKYGVHIQEASNMSKDFEYLSALYAGAKTSGQSTVAVEGADWHLNKWLTPISESTDPLNRMLALEGFNYVAHVEDGALGEKLVDWLDENQVDYLNNGSGQYHIKCADRESVYRVGSAIGRIMRSAGRDNLRDSTAIEEASVKNKEIKGRNPIAIAMAKRGGNGAHNSKDPQRKDPHSRKAKHKNDRAYEDAQIDLDDAVSLDESQENSALNEAITAVTPVNPILRLRELAGLPPAPISPPVAPQPPVSEPVDDADMGDISVPDDMGADFDLGDDLDAPVADDAFAPDAPVEVPLADVAPLEPTMPVAPVLPMQSEAFGQIEDHLNGIQNQLGDVKLSEYKSIVKKLEDLAGQIRMMGRDYLGERRLRR